MGHGGGTRLCLNYFYQGPVTSYYPQNFKVVTSINVCGTYKSVNCYMNQASGSTLIVRIKRRDPGSILNLDHVEYLNSDVAIRIIKRCFRK